MLPLHTHGTLSGRLQHSVVKVLSLSEALTQGFPAQRVLVDLRDATAVVDLGALARVGFAGTLLSEGGDAPSPLPTLASLHLNNVVSTGDVIRIRERGQVSVLYRRGANANFLFATERCNSYCLMCSQPPRDVDDSWRVQEILDVVPLIDRSVPSLGLTGGEPTLLGTHLAEIIASVRTHLPSAQFNILTNGRLLADATLADELAAGAEKVLWCVPLYADTATRHDHVVQAGGAFEETLHGLYNLAERRQAIEIRMVLHASTIGRLVPFAEFIWRNLPFVAHVAFMGLEPMGFAKVNRRELYVDPAEYQGELEAAVWHLTDRGIRASIYNTPLCLLSPSVRRLAKRSISDWKNILAPECEPCTVRESCSGFFKSAGVEWRSRHIQPILKGERHDGFAENTFG